MALNPLLYHLLLTTNVISLIKKKLWVDILLIHIRKHYKKLQIFLTSIDMRNKKKKIAKKYFKK